MEIPIVKKSETKFMVAIEKELYSIEAIVAACYKFTDRFYVFQQTSKQNDAIIDVIFECKDNNHLDDIVVKQFCNELIDQQVRQNTNRQFGYIRDLIVEEAFKPINK